MQKWKKSHKTYAEVKKVAQNSQLFQIWQMSESIDLNISDWISLQFDFFNLATFLENPLANIFDQISWKLSKKKIKAQHYKLQLKILNLCVPFDFPKPDIW